MKKLLILLLVVFLLTPFPAVQATEGTGHLVVLMYHRFDAGGTISTPMSEFKRQINYLVDNDYNVVSLSTVIDHLKHDRPFPEKSVLITIDDGYESTYTHAYPFLKKKGIPWVLYVYTEAIEKGFSSSLSWDQIKTMADNGVAVENHTYSHGHPVSESFRQGDWVQREIEEPHRLIEQKTGQRIKSFAIPYGEYDPKLLRVLNDRYEVVWGIDPGVVDPGSSFPLPRFGINDSTTWTEFKKKLRRLPLRVRNITPAPGEELSTGEQVRIELSRPDRYRQGPINLFLSELGAMEWEWSEDGNSIVTSVDRSLENPWNRVILTAFDQQLGRYRFFSRGFVTEGSKQTVN